MRTSTRNFILTSIGTLATLICGPGIHASTITLTGNPAFAYEGILVGPYAATLNTDPTLLVYCLDLHLDTYVGTRYDGNLSAPNTQPEKEAAFLASYSLYLGAPDGGLVNNVEGPISMAIWQLMGTMGATPQDPAALPFIQFAQSAYSNNLITAAFLSGVSIFTPSPAGSSQRLVTAIHDDPMFLDPASRNASAINDTAPESGTIVFLGSGLLLMALSRVRHRQHSTCQRTPLPHIVCK